MGKKRKPRNGGRPKKEGAREPNGRLQRNVTDRGTEESKHRKLSIMRTTSFELTPLGILAGHGLITEDMYRAADQYRTLFFSGHPDSDRPVAPLPFLAKLPSAVSDLDAPHGKVDELYLRKRFNDLRDKLTADQQEIVHTMAIYGEWPSIIERHAHEIVAHRLRWDDQAGLTHGAPPSITLKKAMAAIRDALEALAEPKRRSPVVSDKVVEPRLKLV